MPTSPHVLADLANGLRIVNQGSDHVLPEQRVHFRVLPLAADVRSAPPEFPVQIKVQWSLSRVEANGTTTPLTAFEALEGLQSVDLFLRLPAQLVQNASEGWFKVHINAQVKVSSGTQSTDWITLTSAALYIMTPAHLQEILSRMERDLEIVRASAGPIRPDEPVALRIHQIPGTEPIPDRVPIRMELEWFLKNGEGGALVRDQDFEAPVGLRSPDVLLQFPALVHGGASEPAALKREVHARVRLGAGPFTTDWRPLIPVPLYLERLPDPAAVLERISQGLRIVPFGSELVEPDGRISFTVEDRTGWPAPAAVPVRTEVDWTVEHPAGTTVPAYSTSGTGSTQFALELLPQELTRTRAANPVGMTVRANVRLKAGQALKELQLSMPFQVTLIAETTA